MPCIHLYVPYTRSTPRFSWQLVSSLKCRIADAAQVSRDDVKIFFHPRKTAILTDDGTLASYSHVFGEVYWYAKENRDQKSMDTIAGALQHFLNVHSLGRDFDLTFFGFPVGAFYSEKDGTAVLVLGGEVLPSFKQIADTVGAHTGFGREE